MNQNLEFLMPKTYKVKYINNGKVFGDKDWYTFYCGKCGAQLNPQAEKCDGTYALLKGCGALTDWNK